MGHKIAPLRKVADRKAAAETHGQAQGPESSAEAEAVMAHHELVDEMTVGECEECGYRGAVFVDNNRCEECDGNFVHCAVCDEEQHADDLCRHVFRDENWEWAGAGIGRPSKSVKRSFFKFLDAIGEEFSVALREAIKDGRFHTWMVAPIIGRGGTLYLRGFSLEDSHKFCKAILEADESEKPDDLVDGWRWLRTLFDTTTGDANNTTIAWIDEWRAAHSGERKSDDV